MDFAVQWPGMPQNLSSRDLQFTLLQARNPTDRVRNEERDAFASRLGVENHQIQQVDILRDTLELPQPAAGHAILVGGAGEYGVVNPIAPVQAMIEYLATAAERGHAIFACPPRLPRFFNDVIVHRTQL